MRSKRRYGLHVAFPALEAKVVPRTLTGSQVRTRALYRPLPDSWLTWAASTRCFNEISCVFALSDLYIYVRRVRAGHGLHLQKRQQWLDRVPPRRSILHGATPSQGLNMTRRVHTLHAGGMHLTESYGTRQIHGSRVYFMALARPHASPSPTDSR